jgi:transposase
MVDSKVTTAVKTFKTTTAELMVLSDWLSAAGATHIAMEATGVYWKPVWHILSDGEFELILANAAHVKNVPGRKTDVNDAVWLADLMAHGLIRPSFVPDEPTQQMRDLLRTRKQMVRERASHIHRFLLKLHLDQIDAFDAALARIDEEVSANVEPFRAAIELLSSIPGISSLAAQVLVSEIGIDMSRFETAGHLVSWAGLCPRNDESAGKRRSTRMKNGAPWLKTTLVQCAWAASRKKNSYLQAQYLRIRSRRGSKKAICAVAASILTASYHMLKNGTLYEDLGANHFDDRAKGKHVLRLVNRLQNLGYDVQITPLAA